MAQVIDHEAEVRVAYPRVSLYIGAIIPAVRWER